MPFRFSHGLVNGGDLVFLLVTAYVLLGEVRGLSVILIVTLRTRFICGCPGKVQTFPFVKWTETYWGSLLVFVSVFILVLKEKDYEEADGAGSGLCAGVWDGWLL